MQKPVYALTQILRPVSFLMNQISFGLLKLLRVDVSPPPGDHRKRTATMVNVSHEEGVIESEEREMITNVVRFRRFPCQRRYGSEDGCGVCKH